MCKTTIDNNILMIALDFPPCKSAGVQRTLKFCQYLPQYHWQPYVLTSYPLIYNELDSNVDIDVPLSKKIYRAFGLNVHKHMTIGGKYIDSFAQPDIYSTWYYHAVIKGKSIIKDIAPDVIWSTHPCLTAHKIAAKLKRYSGLPWIADYRDPFKGHSNSIYHNDSGKAIDKQTIYESDIVVFATTEMKDLYIDSYPQVNSEKFIVIENGYNDDFFDEFATSLCMGNNKKSNILRIIHSGELYEQGRNPTNLFLAISNSMI